MNIQTETEVKEVPGLTRDELARFLVEHQCFVGAELGVQKGEYSEILLNAGVSVLVLVDLWAKQANYFDIANVENHAHNQNLRETVQRLVRFGTRYHIFIGSTLDQAILDRILPGSLDFVYHDSQHSKGHVTAELEAWYPKVRPGGYITGHDYLDSPNCCGSEFGVKTAVREFCARIGVTEIFQCQTDGPFHNWHFQKPVAPAGAIRPSGGASQA